MTAEAILKLHNSTQNALDTNPIAHTNDVDYLLRTTKAAYQPFEHGMMFWLIDMGMVYILYYDGTWQTQTDTFIGEISMDVQAPVGFYQPQGGFGAIWQNLPGVAGDLGWARTEREITYLTFVEQANSSDTTHTETRMYFQMADGTTIWLRNEAWGRI